MIAIQSMVSVVDKARVMHAVDQHIKTGISSIPSELSTHELFKIYATCTDIYSDHINTSKKMMKNVGGDPERNIPMITNAAVDEVKSYLSKTYPPIPLKITPTSTPKEDQNAIKAARKQVKVAEAMLKSSIGTCRIMRGSYKP